MIVLPIIFEEPIVVPNHHSILMSLIGAEIPYTFYNFVDGRNTRLDYVITAYGVPVNYDANGIITGYTTITIPSGNYTAPELATLIQDEINSVTPGLCTIRFNTNTSNRITMVYFSNSVFILIFTGGCVLIL